MGFWSSFETFIHYKAPKYVEVRSLNLGIVSKLPLLLIFLYIFAYQLGYENRHLVKSQPAGLGRMQLQRPTKDHCNPNHADCLADFTPIPELSYCLPHSANISEHKGEKAGGRLPCRFMDEKQMNPVGFQHFTTMIPTRISRTRQQATGNCGPHSKKECENVYTFTEEEESSVYIADVERFTLLIETAFTLPPADLRKTPVKRGASNDFPGYWEVCDDPRRHTGCRNEKIPCLVGDCDGPETQHHHRRLRGSNETSVEDPVEARKLADKATFFGLPFGDVISVGELLRIAGVDLDTDTDIHGEARRSTGIALQIDVAYDNRMHFNWPPWQAEAHKVQYVYRVSKLPFQTYKEVSEEIQENGDRVLIDKHGIFVNVNIEGSIYYFDLTQLLLILTTGLSLLAGADTAVHFFASNVWKHKDEYKMEKVDRSRNYDKDEKLCFCCSIPSHEAHNSNTDHNWEHFTENPHDFTMNLRALDGETLQHAGDLLMALHRMKTSETGDSDFVRKEREQWELDLDQRKGGDESAESAKQSTKDVEAGPETSPLVGASTREVRP